LRSSKRTTFIAKGEPLPKLAAVPIEADKRLLFKVENLLLDKKVPKGRKIRSLLHVIGLYRTGIDSDQRRLNEQEFWAVFDH
jgi:hypothetical protein